MLVISRKAGESLVIGSDIVISVLNVGSDKVTIGLDAPKDVPIVRSELVDIIEANIEAAQVKAEPEALARLLRAQKK